VVVDGDGTPGGLRMGLHPCAEHQRRDGGVTGEAHGVTIRAGVDWRVRFFAELPR